MTKDSVSSGEELEQLTVPDNISPVETDEEIPGRGKAAPAQKHVVCAKTGIFPMI